MSLTLTEACLDDWQKWDTFRLDFLRWTTTLSKVVGYSFEFDQEVLRVAHLNWCARCQFWQQERIAKTSNGLSHIKILALLLHHLASAKWITVLHEFDPELDGRNAMEFNGTPEHREEVRADLNAGRGTYLAFQFIIAIINWFEYHRIDRKQPYLFRLTTDLEHDLMVYLLSESRDELAIYLILKALYTRDPK